MFHTHSFRCCIHTSYGPTCRIRTHSTSFVSHVSYKHHYVSFIRRIIRTSFATCIIKHSYNIIYDIHHILIIRICIICYHYTSYSIIYLTCMRSYIHTASFKSYVCHITSYMNLILWSQRWHHMITYVAEWAAYDILWRCIQWTQSISKSKSSQWSSSSISWSSTSSGWTWVPEAVFFGLWAPRILSLTLSKRCSKCDRSYFPGMNSAVIAMIWEQRQLSCMRSYDTRQLYASVCDMCCMNPYLSKWCLYLTSSEWVQMIHFSKWALMYCRLCAPPHTQSECCKNCILCTRLLNDVIWYGHKWCHMSFIWDMCMTSVWCDRCMQFEWYGSPVWRHMIQSCMIINDTKWFTYATGVVSSRCPTRVV